MQRRDFLRAAAGAFAGQTASTQTSGRKPNFLVILADDMGYSDARCFGGDVDTPNLDALAKGGLRFTQMYSTARCGPSRSCILTGQYAQQTACDVMTPGNIPHWNRFGPEHLKPLGYRAYHSGKWHIRFKALAGVGFDKSYALMDQDRFFTPRVHYLDDAPLPAVKPEENYYATVAIADHAIKTLKQHNESYRQSPFFHYLAFTSPHFPLHALQQDIDKYKDRFSEGWDVARQRHWERMKQMGLINCALSKLDTGIWPPWNLPTEELMQRIGPGEVTRAVPWNTLTAEQKKLQRTKMAIHAAMISRMDHEIGRVVEQLKAMDAFRDTVILFVSDNGASAEQIIRGDLHDAAAPPGSGKTYLSLGPGWSSSSNSPFRLHKSWVHEGGISSPMIAHWPAGITAKNELRHNPCHFVDIVPTMLDLAGGKPNGVFPAEAPPFAGKSFAPVFRKDNTVPREWLYFHHNNNRAIRAGNMKLVAIGKDGPWELYDLKKDRCEQVNLAEKQPEKAQELAALWQRVEDDFVKTREAAAPSTKPLMQPNAGAGKKKKKA